MPSKSIDSEPDLCLQCGNPVRPQDAVCPYCGHTGREIKARVRLQELDIGHGNMTGREATESLARALDDVRAASIPVLVVVHGYGSSGQGGIIRKLVHTTCRDLQSQGAIRVWIPGDYFGASSDLARSLARDYPELKESPHWNASNPGVTLLFP